VNGERVLGERALHAGDEIRVGSTRLVFRADPRAGAHTTATHTAKQAPELTRRERDVLVELCRPLVSGDLFTEPASTREIAECLFLTEPTVKQHLQHLYPKFGIHEGVRRRARLANEAVARGAVNLAELRRQP
jgi:DNA-binding CsgD family transcriptional regulator